MANVTVHKVNPAEVVKTDNGVPARPLFQWMETAVENIRNRAFELFKGRGGMPGFDIDDWLRAERELFAVPDGDLVKAGDMYSIRLDVPGFDETNVEVTTTPEAIVIRGKTKAELHKEDRGITFEEFEEKSLYRRFEFDAPVDVSKVTAELDKGVLKILAPVRSTTPAVIEKKAATTENVLPETGEVKTPKPVRTAAA